MLSVLCSIVRSMAISSRSPKSFVDAPAEQGRRSSIVGFSPDLKVFSRLIFRRRVEANDSAALQNFLGHKILKGGHLDCFIRDLISQMRWHDHNSLRIANDDVARKDRSIATADRSIYLDCLMQREVGRGCRPIVVGRK